MSRHPGAFARSNCLTPTDPALLATPLSFIHEDHLREREICALLDGIADAQPPETAAAIAENRANALGFLRVELPLHLEDEDQDLFPLLRRRCARDDDIDRILARLSTDHRHANADTPKVIALLDMLDIGSHGLTADDRLFLHTYAAHARRHLLLENALILPFSRLRLTAGDLESLRLRMTQRRGLT